MDEIKGPKVTDKRHFDSKGERKRDIEEEPEKENTGTSAPPGKNTGPGEQAPNIFLSLVISLANSAVINLGEAENPVTGKKNKNLPEARYTIDLIETLKEKTAGNLTQEESNVLDSLLYELRTKFVQANNSDGVE